jgi:hypothetical protein
LRTAGGFSERFSNEDTALSLDLAGLGWRVATVDTWSYDREPRDYSGYARRSVRWSGQTAALMGAPWHRVPLPLKLMLCRWLLGCVTPQIALVLLGLSLWLGPTEWRSTAQLIQHAWSLDPGLRGLGLVLWVGALATCWSIVLELLVFRRSGGVLALFLLSLMHRYAVGLCLSIPIALTVARALSGTRSVFVPTNSRAVEARRGARALLAASCVGGGAVALFLGVGAWRHPGSLAVGLTALWTLLFLLSPSILLATWASGRSSTELRGS